MDDSDEQLYYATGGPDSDEVSIPDLQEAYSRTVNDLGDFLTRCQRNRSDRRNEWAGKTWDLRKGGEDAFPWKGASDQEVHVIGERLDTFVALAMSALSRSHIRALAVKMESMARASTVTAFMKWMASTYIKHFHTQHELACNHGFEKDLMISYVGWETKERTFKVEMNLEEIRAINPDFALMVESESDDEGLADMLLQSFPKLSVSRARKAIRQLRAKGSAELYVSRASPMDSRPVVKACAPDYDVFYPPYCHDPQESPYVFWRQTYTPQQIEGFVQTQGWDRKWAKEMIANYRGVGVDNIAYESTYLNAGASEYNGTSESNRDLILVVHAYQKLIDPEDGSEGIYCTDFNPYYTGDSADAPAMAKRELLSGVDQYPFVVTRMNAGSESIYDVQAMPEKLRGAQFAVKVERDSRADRNSLATLPPREGPPGREPSDWGPGRYVPVRRRGEIGYIEAPQYNAGSVEMEQTIIKMADGICGLDPENPITPFRQQFYVNKTLAHARDVLRMAYKNFQRYGPDEVFFTVTGVPDPITMENIETDEFDVNITFDTLSTDPETMKARAEQMASLMSFDKTGRLDNGKFMEFLAYSIDPAFADYILLPQEENSAKLQKQITDDFAKLYSGVEIGPPPNGAQVVLQMGQLWMQQPDVAQRMQSDKAFAERAKTYFGQAEFQIQQAQNAQIGRIGTAPADFQGANITA